MYTDDNRANPIYSLHKPELINESLVKRHFLALDSEFEIEIAKVKSINFLHPSVAMLNAVKNVFEKVFSIGEKLKSIESFYQELVKKNESWQERLNAVHRMESRVKGVIELLKMDIGLLEVSLSASHGINPTSLATLPQYSLAREQSQGVSRGVSPGKEEVPDGFPLRQMPG